MEVGIGKDGDGRGMIGRVEEGYVIGSRLLDGVLRDFLLIDS
jgi:hypothetical protein